MTGQLEESLVLKAKVYDEEDFHTSTPKKINECDN